MMNIYVGGKGIYLGEFSEQDIRDKKDREEVKRVQAETGLKYVRLEDVKKGKKIIALKVYVCKLEDSNL